MKKLFMIGLAATAMLASCSNDETVEMAPSKAIGFSNAFVNNGTRSIVDPSFTTKTFRKFWKIFITTLLASSSEDKVKMR